MRRITRSARADDDLLDIWLYIAARNPAAADRILDAIDRALSRLRAFPLSGIARDDIRPGIRRLVVGNYLIFYRVTDTVIEVVRVVHGRRKIDSDIIKP